MAKAAGRRHLFSGTFGPALGGHIPCASSVSARFPHQRRLYATKSSEVSHELHDNFLRLQLNEGSNEANSFDFHYFWLRHNCNCQPHCRHPKTGERIIDSSEVPLSISPSSITVGHDNKITIVWKGDSHRTEFDLDWLKQHSYATNRHSKVAPPPADLSTVQLHYGRNGTTHEDYLKHCAKSLKHYGVVVVRNRGMDTEEIISDFLPKGSDVIHTHFGRIEDLMTNNTTNKNTDQLGYTDAPVHLHTDQPFIKNPPGMQMLHGIRPADTGGENLMVDSIKAALYLKHTDRVAYETLTTVPVHFHRKQKDFESLEIRPIIELNDKKEPKQVRYSYFTMAPQRVAFEEMENWYRSYNKFAQIVRDPAHQYRFTLGAGDFVLYDNFRMLHARTGFTGPRHLRGVYFNHVDVWKKLAISPSQI